MNTIEKSNNFNEFRKHLNNITTLNIIYGITLGRNSHTKLKKVISQNYSNKNKLNYDELKKEKLLLDGLFLGYKPISERTLLRYLKNKGYKDNLKSNFKNKSLIEFNIIEINNNKIAKKKKEEFTYRINYLKIFIYFLEYIEEKIKNRTEELNKIIEKIRDIENSPKTNCQNIIIDKYENEISEAPDFADTYMARLIDIYIQFNSLQINFFKKTSNLNQETIEEMEKIGFFEDYYIITKENKCLITDRESKKNLNIKKEIYLGTNKINNFELAIFIDCFNYHLWVRANNYITATLKDVFEDIIVDFADENLICSKFKNIHLEENKNNSIKILNAYKLIKIPEGILYKIYFIFNKMNKTNTGTGILKKTY